MTRDSASASILVVEDEDNARATLCDVFQEAGYECSGVESGEEALSFLNNGDVDVVVTDIRMSGLDGLALTEIVKKDHDADVIIITGYGSEFSYEEALETGASDFVEKPVRPRELIARLRRVLRERNLVAERKEMEERLRELTVTDDLTRLYNSRHFFGEIQAEMGRADRYNHPLSLLLLDVDNFKHYNDTYGHLEGDKVLAELGKVIQCCLRKHDTGYRYGGDEFVVILPETRGVEATKVSERIRKEFQAVDFSPKPDKTLCVTISIGVTECRLAEGWKELTKRADEAMYQAKEQGGNRSLLL